jgi:DNA polymerase-3 subunit chi
MQEVAFHFNAPDKLGYACRLLRKAHARGARLMVLAEPADVSALDQQLWTLAQGEFIAHCRSDDPPHVRAHSPILIASAPVLPADFEAQVLVNLTQQMPQDFERFDRVIEVVSSDEGDRLLARERWRAYRQAGHEPVQHDLRRAAA